MFDILKYSLQIATFKCLSVMCPRADTSNFQHRKNSFKTEPTTD